MYLITFKRSAEKEIRRLPNQIIKKLSIAIDGLSSNPRPPGCKKLEGQKESLWRIRIREYRVIYSIEDTIKIIEIRRVGHRKDVYE